jgi:hypothetical protein
MFEISSPFDEALSRPFLDEPVKKRWSWLSSRSTSSESSSSSRTSSPPFGLNIEYRNNTYSGGSNAAVAIMEEISFSPVGDEEEGSFVVSSFSLMEQQQHERAAFDTAILQERHADITEINTSMRQLNEIQKGMYALSTELFHD